MIKPKNRKHLNFKVWEKEALKNPKFKAEYDLLQPEFAVIEAIIKARAESGLTQKELAQKIGTKQSVISRLESGRGNPSVAFLKKFASALDTNLQIKFTSI